MRQQYRPLGMGYDGGSQPEEHRCGSPRASCRGGGIKNKGTDRPTQRKRVVQTRDLGSTGWQDEAARGSCYCRPAGAQGRNRPGGPYGAICREEEILQPVVWAACRKPAEKLSRLPGRKSVILGQDKDAAYQDPATGPGLQVGCPGPYRG